MYFIVVVLCEQDVVFGPPVEDVIVHVALGNMTVSFGSLFVEVTGCETVWVPRDH